MKTISRITLIFLVLAGSLFAAPKPRIMQIVIGGYSGVSYEVIYDGRDLKYYEAPNMFDLKKAAPEIIQASDKSWEDFFTVLNELNTWKWREDYIDPNARDGTTWYATIVYNLQGDRSMVCYGSNLYPRDFDRFLGAVSALVGGRRFK